MHSSSQRALSTALAVSLGLSGGPLVAAPKPPARDKKKDDTSRIVHVLNRLGYGARPGEVEKVARMGVEAWTDLQLHPEKVPDGAVAARLAGLRTASLSSSELLSRYDIPQDVKREIQRKRAEMGEASEEQMRQARQELIQKYAGRMDGPPRLVLEELQAAKLMRAIYSERQLDEVMVDFWLNHFNVFAGKGPEKFLLAEYEREAIRPHAWGRFEDLLRATAESPAMLFYLDNWLSVDPSAIARLAEQRGARMQGRGQGFGGRRPRPGAQGAGLAALPGLGRARGLNENYAREIMELHTLGVEGGYTQKDVTEVARCFTGWTIKGLRQEHPEFTFEPRLHDPGEKVVLGHTIKGGGKEEAEKVIHLLATHPSTARFVSYKLARHFVADEPPQALVERAAETFRKTDGDIRAVVKAIVTSPEFFAEDARGAKVKTPLEFVASAVRASGATVEDARDLLRRLASMGMPLYEQQPPTGYKDTAEAWVSTSGLLSRLNLALDLAGGRVRGVSFDSSGLTSEHYGAPLADALAAQLVPGGLSPSTRQTLDREIESSTPARVAGLILGSPEFQRR